MRLLALCSSNAGPVPRLKLLRCVVSDFFLAYLDLVLRQLCQLSLSWKISHSEKVAFTAAGQFGDVPNSS